MIVNRIQGLSEVLHFGLGGQATTVDADKTYVYDAFGVVTNETVVGIAGTNVLERFHDAFGRDAGYALNGVRRTTLAYDSATGRIASMGVWEGRAPSRPPSPFRWTYLPGSDLKESLAYPNGDVVRWEYEPRRDLVTLVSNGVHSSFRYAYDAAGRRIAKNDERYQYNPRGELVLSTNVVTGAEFAYRYDDIGNRLWSRELGTNCTYAANELNQYTDIVRGGVDEFPAFDLDGNQTNIVTSTGEWAVGYNGENRPIRWTRNADGTVVTMSYDIRGRRVTKNAEWFVYDGYLNIGQTVWDPTEPVATRPLVWLGEDGSAYFFHDGNKNVVDFVPTGVTPSACHYVYTPFGTDTGSVGDTDINPWRFRSESIDKLLKLTYYNYRHYDLRIGRWINRDPIELLDDESSIEEDSSTKSSYRRNEAEVRISLCYVFVSNMPSMRFDMQGLIDVLCTCISTAPSDGSEVGPKLNGNVCGAATLGTSFSSTHNWPCMAQPLFNDMDRIECFCAGRTCTQEIQYSCTERITKRQIHVYNWTVSGSKTSGCQ